MDPTFLTKHKLIVLSHFCIDLPNVLSGRRLLCFVERGVHFAAAVAVICIRGLFSFGNILHFTILAFFADCLMLSLFLSFGV